MNTIEQEYICRLKKSVYDKIQKDINENTIEQIINDSLIKAHFEDKISANFQKYYFTILNNEKSFWNHRTFLENSKNNTLFKELIIIFWTILKLKRTRS